MIYIGTQVMQVTQNAFQMVQDGETDFNFGAGMSNVDGRFAWQRIPFLLPDLETVREKLASLIQKDIKSTVDYMLIMG